MLGALCPCVLYLASWYAKAGSPGRARLPKALLRNSCRVRSTPCAVGLVCLRIALSWLLVWLDNSQRPTPLWHVISALPGFVVCVFFGFVIP